MCVQSQRDNDDTITVTRGDGWYVAKDEATGIASQGQTKVKALENLAEALALHNQPVPEDDSTDLDESTAPWL